MGLFSPAQTEAINAAAVKSKAKPQSSSSISAKSIDGDLKKIYKQVENYFQDSPAILITNVNDLHDYITKCIEAKSVVGVDTETTGLDKINDHIVGFSLYYPGGVEAYIPNKHKVPIFDTYYKDQLSYEECTAELQRLIDAKVPAIFANADFDIAMIWKDMKVNFALTCTYDVILSWRCLKENEPDNALKVLYNKYVLKGHGDPKKFSDFFSPQLFPYCKPEVAKLYAANDAKITVELFFWQLPYVTKTDKKCMKNHLEKIADIVWNVETPLIQICAMMHRTGMYLDQSITNVLKPRYNDLLTQARKDLADSVQELIETKLVPGANKRPFASGKDFNPNSNKDVLFLLNTYLELDVSSTGKNVLEEYRSIKVINQILSVRKLVKLIGTYIEKMPNAIASDKRIHGSFKSIGADTGRFSSSDPNMQNIPSKKHDIRHMFRATPESTERVQANIIQDKYVIDVNIADSVHTPDGETPVRNLKIGDTLILETLSGQPVEKTIFDISKFYSDVRLTINE